MTDQAFPLGVVISQQEPGTIIRHPKTGEEFTVTDGNAVNMGHTIYVTPRNYEAIKAQTTHRKINS